MTTIQHEAIVSNPVSLRLAPEVRSRLEREAKKEQRSISFIAQEAIVNHLDAKDWRHREIMQAYEASLAETDFISEESMTTWVNSWGTGNVLPMPKADVKLMRR